MNIYYYAKSVLATFPLLSLSCFLPFLAIGGLSLILAAQARTELNGDSISAKIGECTNEFLFHFHFGLVRCIPENNIFNCNELMKSTFSSKRNSHRTNIECDRSSDLTIFPSMDMDSPFEIA